MKPALRPIPLLCLAALLARTSPALAQENTASTPPPSIEGIVTFHGEIPRSALPDDTGVHRELVRVDPKTRAVQDVVLWLVPAHTNTANIPNPPPQSASPATPALMDQFAHEFVPRVLAVRTGQPVRFTNSDPANHNVRTSSPLPTNQFNVFTGIDGAYTHRFAANPDHRPIRIGCDIHPWMRAWIYVFEHPWFAVTNDRGEFRIASVPPGEYKLLLRQPDLNHAHEQLVTVTEARPSRLELKIHANTAKRPQ